MSPPTLSVSAAKILFNVPWKVLMPFPPPALIESSTASGKSSRSLPGYIFWTPRHHCCCGSHFPVRWDSLLGLILNIVFPELSFEMNLHVDRWTIVNVLSFLRLFDDARVYAAQVISNNPLPILTKRYRGYNSVLGATLSLCVQAHHRSSDVACPFVAHASLLHRTCTTHAHII